MQHKAIDSYVASDFGKWMAAPFISVPHKEHPKDGSGRKQRRPFNGAVLAKLMAEISAMLYLGAYVVNKTGNQVPRQPVRAENRN